MSIVRLAPTKRVNFDELIEATCETLQFLEPWNSASTKNQALTSTLDRVKTQAVDYYEAVDMSANVAKLGSIFSSDAEALCDFLLDPKMNRGDLLKFINEMREMASEAHEDATKLSLKFRSVRRGIFQITKDIPADMDNLHQQEQAALKRKAGHERMAGHAKAVTKFFSKKLTVNRVFICPPLILLPVVLPILKLITNTTENRFNIVAERRGTEARGYRDAMEQLRQVTCGLETLMNHVDMFADWWIEMDTILASIEDHVDRVQLGSPAMIGITKSHWVSAKGMYVDYLTKVKRLQDYYPSDRKNIDWSTV